VDLEPLARSSSGGIGLVDLLRVPGKNDFGLLPSVSHVPSGCPPPRRETSYPPTFASNCGDDGKPLAFHVEASDHQTDSQKLNADLLPAVESQAVGEPRTPKARIQGQQAKSGGFARQISPLSAAPSVVSQSLPESHRQTTDGTGGAYESAFVMETKLRAPDVTAERSLTQLMEEKSPIAMLKIIMSNNYVEALWASLIIVNILVMILEVQFEGSRVGYQLNVYSYYGSPDYVSRMWPGDTDLAFEITEYSFALLFTLELTLRLIAFGRKAWQDKWSYLDTGVVVCTDLSILLKSADFEVNFNVNVVRILRAVRAVRVLRLLRSMEKLQSLHVMTTALQACVTSAAWALVILFLVETVFALILTKFFQIWYLGGDSVLTSEQKREAYLYFGSYARAMVSMFELALANWPTICRFLMEDVHEAWMIFVVLHRLMVGFAVLGIVNAVFMQETFSATENDDNLMVTKKIRARRSYVRKMKALFSHADEDGNGQIGPRQFARVMRDPAIRTWLAAMDLDFRSVRLLFSLIDDGGNSDGTITVDELVDGVQRLRGAARAIDVKILLRRIEALEKSLARGEAGQV
jgi:voltage-gated sodium channel